MHKPLERTIPGHDTGLDPAALVAALECQGTRHPTPCGRGHMAWRRWGDGPPVVLMHGGGGAWPHWIRNVGPLSGRYTVWALDIPALGESAAPEPLSVEAIADAVERGLRMLLPGNEAVSLVGFSFGAALSTMVAVRLKERLRDLVLVGARFVLNPPRIHPRLLSWKKIEDPAARLAVHRKNLGVLMFGDPDNIDALALYLQSTNTQRARVSAPMLSPSPSQKLHEYLPRVRARGRITGISGALDQAAKTVMDMQGSALQAIQPGARFHVIENAGHWVQYEAAERFNEILLDALSAGATRPGS